MPLFWPLGCQVAQVASCWPGHFVTTTLLYFLFSIFYTLYSVYFIYVYIQVIFYTFSILKFKKISFWENFFFQLSTRFFVVLNWTLKSIIFILFFILFIDKYLYSVLCICYCTSHISMKYAYIDIYLSYLLLKSRF